MREEDDIPPTSDVDVLLIFPDGSDTVSRQKHDLDGLSLDVSSIACNEVATAETILRTYHLAGSLRQTESILFDPHSHLKRLQIRVGQEFADPVWVMARRRDAEARVRRNLDRINEVERDLERLSSWIFGTGVTTHIVLTAGLQNPTVRTRYAATRTLLASANLADRYGFVADLLDPGHATTGIVQTFIRRLALLFDETVSLRKSADINPACRSAAIDAAHTLVEQGYPRDALFWIGVTAIRCATLLDSLEVRSWEPLIGDLAEWFQVGSTREMNRRANLVRERLPEIQTLAGEVFAAISPVNA
jgi:hypothetical protein